jgi:hypothetical protein
MNMPVPRNRIMNSADDSLWLTGFLAFLALVYAVIYQLMTW